MTGDALLALLRELFPDTRLPGLSVDQVHDDGVRLRQTITPRHLRPGGTVSGPTLMTLTDTAVYLALLARDPDNVAAVTSDLHIRFLHRPAPDADLLADARLLRVGRTLATAAVDLISDGRGLVAHATVGYGLPAR